MNNLSIFKNEKFGAVRTVFKDEQVWIAAKDIAKVLGISKYRDALARLDPDERMSTKMDTLGGSQGISMINESGFYAWAFKSDKPEAKAFRKWVTSEVLPELRKTGSYQLHSQIKQLETEKEAAVSELTYLKTTFAPKKDDFGSISKFNGKQRIFPRCWHHSSRGKRKFTFHDGQPYLPFFEAILKNTTGNLEIEIVPRKAQGSYERNN